MIIQKNEINSMVPINMYSKSSYKLTNDNIDSNYIMMNEVEFRKILFFNIMNRNINRYKHVVNPTFIL